MNYIDVRKKQILRRRFETRELLINLKSQPCVDCGNKYHYCQMDFMLRDGDDRPLKIKDFLNRSKKRIVEEISKRDLVCANCGRLRTWKLQRKQREGLS